MASNTPRVFEQPSRQTISTTSWSRLHRALLACAGDDGHLYLYDVNHGAKALAVMRNAHDGPVGEVCFSQSGRYSLWSAGWDGKVKMTDVEKKKITWAASTQDPATSVTAHSAGSYVAVGDSSGFVQVFDLRNNLKPLGRWAAHKGGVKGVRYQHTDRRSPSSAPPRPLFTLSTPTKPRANSPPARLDGTSKENTAPEAIGGMVGSVYNPFSSTAEARNTTDIRDRTLMSLFSPVARDRVANLTSEAPPPQPRFHLPEPRVLVRPPSTSSATESEKSVRSIRRGASRSRTSKSAETVNESEMRVSVAADVVHKGDEFLADGDVMSMFSPVSKTRSSTMGSTNLFRSLSTRTRSGPGFANDASTPNGPKPSLTTDNSPGSDHNFGPETPTPSSPVMRTRADFLSLREPSSKSTGTEPVPATLKRSMSVTSNRDRLGDAVGEMLTIADLEAQPMPQWVMLKPGAGSVRKPNDGGASASLNLGSVKRSPSEGSTPFRDATVRGVSPILSASAVGVRTFRSESTDAAAAESNVEQSVTEDGFAGDYPYLPSRISEINGRMDASVGGTPVLPNGHGLQSESTENLLSLPNLGAGGSAATTGDLRFIHDGQQTDQQQSPVLYSDQRNGVTSARAGDPTSEERQKGHGVATDSLVFKSKPAENVQDFIFFDGPQQHRGPDIVFNNVQSSNQPVENFSPPQNSQSALAAYLQSMSPNPANGSSEGQRSAGGLRNTISVAETESSNILQSSIATLLGNIDSAVKVIADNDLSSSRLNHQPSATNARTTGLATSMSSTSPAFQQSTPDFNHQILHNAVDQALQQFRAGIRNDIQNMHLELLRQFQAQRDELQSLLITYTPTQMLLDEMQALREENDRLRRLF
ncbi:Protein nedd1 [Gonapodya sp. JEL0774]|nr:Protein nedd1 [Gonapodya sp. JEL0774]